MTQASTIPADEIKTRKVELVLQQLDSLPTLPIVATRLLSLTGSAETKIQEVVTLLSSDQSLTSKLLSLVNSAAVGLRSPITSVQQAVVMLGFETVRNIVLSVKVFEVFKERSESAEENAGAAEAFSRIEFWKHSLAVATAAEMLAGRAKPKLNIHDAFVCGLVHDIGKVAFDTAMPKSFARVIEVAMLTRGDVADVERRIIGLDHGLAGKRLAEAWNLPQVIAQTVWLHGAPPPPSTPSNGNSPHPLKSAGLVDMGIVLTVGLADLLVRRQHIGFSGNFLFPYETRQYALPLGLTEHDIDEVTQHLTDALEIKARSLGLYDVGSRQLYLESIANANAELGRMNQTLAMQNRKLQARSACFEMMTRFYQRIVPAASPAQLLSEVGQVAHQFLESPRLVLFSQDPNQTPRGDADNATVVGDVLTFDPTQSVQDSFLMSMPPYGGDHRIHSSRAGQNFIRPAQPQFDWLLDRVQAFLGTSQCWFMPLLCGNEPVGGILWMAKDGGRNDAGGNSMAEVADLVLVSQAWGMTLRTAQIREQQTLLTESLAAANRELGTLQQQLVRVKSLSELGEMAAGAAHEMNNPLAVVCGRAQLLAAKLTDTALKQDASLIAQQGDRLSQIITDMMEFAKPQVPKVGAVNFEQVAQEAVSAGIERAGATMGDVAKVKLEVTPGIPSGRGDSRQLKNAITEVILNALQATRAAESHESGASAPATGPRDVLVQVRFDALDSQVIVQVTDRGIGMNEEIMRQAFSPFFSAKSAGRNRGIGLAKALRWVESHGGTIRLDSTPNVGTIAVVILPLAGISDTIIKQSPTARPGSAPAKA